jgi:SAM-dependent methyltransferase
MAAPRVRQAGSVVGVDMNEAMLSVAEKAAVPGGAAIRWLQGDALALPIASGSVDVTLCQHALTFFPDRIAAVREMNRVLAPGGRALTMVLQRLDLHPVFEALMESVARHLGVPLARVAIPFALPDAGALGSLFEGGGFAEVEVRRVSATMRFLDPNRFVPMAVVSSAAAVPAFAALDGELKSALMDGIANDCRDVVAAHAVDGNVVFDMFAHVAIARAATAPAPGR